MNISNSISSIITNMRLKYQVNQINSDNVIDILKGILSTKVLIKNIDNDLEKFKDEEKYFLKNLDFLNDAYEGELKNIVNQNYFVNNKYFFYDYIEKVLNLYMNSSDDEKKNLIEYAMRNPEVLLTHDVTTIELN